jgi:hypothetical protein
LKNFREVAKIFHDGLQELKQRLERVTQQNGAHIYQRDWNDELLTIRTGLVTFHGEVILMESYSALNYTGLFHVITSSF